MDCQQIAPGPGAALVAEAEELGDAVARLRRVGLVVEPAALSPANRRIAYALVRHEAARLQPVDATPAAAPAIPLTRIGFAYPNAR